MAMRRLNKTSVSMPPMYIRSRYRSESEFASVQLGVNFQIDSTNWQLDIKWVHRVRVSIAIKTGEVLNEFNSASAFAVGLRSGSI